MKITLITAVIFEESSQRVIPNIGLYYLQSYIEKYAPQNEVTVARTPEEVISSKPDIVGISSVTENVHIARTWAKTIKDKLGVPVILGGDHISALPHLLPPEFDIGVVGEGEETFLELVNLIGKEKNWTEMLSGTKGISWRGKDGVVVNEPRPLIENLEKIPYPVRDKNVWGGFHYLFSSRGCMYNCSFCSPKVIWKKYRAFPADYVIGELKEIFENFNPYYIHFFDDLFIGNRSRVKELRKLVREAGYHQKVGFGGHIRADLIDDEICRDLRMMNFISGAFGAETGSDKILKFLKTGSSTVEMNQRAIDICHSYGIQLNLSFIIGTPGETEEDINMTIDFIEKNKKKMSGIEIFIVLPYPGTPIWTLCKRKGQVSDDMDWRLFKTKAYFSELEITDDFLYINDAMDRDTFRKYVKTFQQIDAELNKNNIHIYEYIEKTIPVTKL